MSSVQEKEQSCSLDQQMEMGIDGGWRIQKFTCSVKSCLENISGNNPRVMEEFGLEAEKLKAHPVPISFHVQGHIPLDQVVPKPIQPGLEHPTGPPSELWLRDVPKGVSQVPLFVTDFSRMIYTNMSEDPECAFPDIYRDLESYVPSQ